MRDDELQVLGQTRKVGKREKLIKGILSVAAVIALVATGAFLHKSFFSNDSDWVENNTNKTIIPKLQEAVDSMLNRKLEEIKGLQGQVIIMKVDSGEILAMAGRERNYEGKFQPCMNFAYQQVLGALVKVPSLLAALETGEAKLSDVVDTESGIWQIDDERVLKDHNWLRGGYGEITLDKSIEISSNIGIGKTIWRLYKGHEQDFFNSLDSMSFGQPSEIDGIEGLRASIYSSPKDSDWVNKDIIWSSIGYNHKIAPIQVLTFYNAIANNGKMVKPTLKPGSIEIINEQIASKENITLMQQTLEHVVSQGLGVRAAVSLIKVAGKTATSQVDEYYEGDSTVREYQLAFCGFFPADDPKYSMIVSLNKLGLPVSGGGMAGTLFHDIVECMIAHGINMGSVVK